MPNISRNAPGMDRKTLDSVLVMITLHELAQTTDRMFRRLVVGCSGLHKLRTG